MFKQLFFPLDKIAGYKFDDEDFNEFLLDKHFVQELLKLIEENTTFDSIGLFYPENSGSFYISLAKEIAPKKLTVVESNRYHNFHLPSEANDKNSGLANREYILASSPFAYITKNQLIVIRDDKLNTGRFVKDLYDMGFQNTVISIGAWHDEKFWKSLPISKLKLETIDQTKNPNLNLLFHPKYKRKWERSVQQIPVAVFQINKNSQPKDKKKVIRQIEDYYVLDYPKEDEISSSDVFNEKSFQDIYKYLPSTKNSLQLTFNQILNPMHHAIVKNILDWTNSRVENLNLKTLHHLAFQSPVTAIPFSKFFKQIYVYQSLMKMGRIYDKESKEIALDTLLTHSEYTVLEDDLKAYPDIDNVDIGIEKIQILRWIKDGDMILIEQTNVELIIDDLVENNFKNIHVLFLNTSKLNLRFRNKTVQKLSTQSFNVENFYREVAKNNPKIRDYIRERIDHEEYRFNIELYLVNPVAQKATLKEPVLETFEEPVAERVAAQVAEEEVAEENGLVLKQDLYQYIDDFDVLIEFAKVIIDQFPTLGPDGIKVVSNALMNKIKDGVTYGPELEKMIQIVFPKIKQLLQ